ncbi:MAG TPA: hypothetical protein VHY79_15005 [Rhizomicrobium sp.]|nr:hypothetical protein [Rhizomicrobium sp.]
MRKEKQTEPAKKIKPLLDPNQPREDVTETGGEYAGRYPTDNGPGIVSPGTHVQADGQTTHE